jgi:hypothetical protein
MLQHSRRSGAFHGLSVAQQPTEYPAFCIRVNRRKGGDERCRAAQLSLGSSLGRTNSPTPAATQATLDRRTTLTQKFLESDQSLLYRVRWIERPGWSARHPL